MLLTVLFALAATCSGSNYKRVCYYTNWSQYRAGAGKFSMRDIDPFLCTHLIYSFIEIGTNNELKLREWNGETLIAESMILKQANPQLKISAAVGGWNAGTTRFTALCESESTMRHFAKTTVSFLRKYAFDGIDLDWEYPGSRGSPAEDYDNFPRLLEIMREEFERDASAGDQLLLTAGVSGGQYTMESGYNIKEICRLVDFAHLMTYDYHGGSFETLTGHNSPLYGNTGLPEAKNFNVDWAARTWLDQGCPKDKLILGVPTYGRTYTLTDRNNWGYNASASGAGLAGVSTREPGFLAYFEICSQIPRGRVWYEPEVLAPVLVVDDQWIGYDDKVSLTTKVQYMKDLGLGGIMVWSVESDDFDAVCGEKYPLLRTIYRELEGDDSPSCFVSPTTEAVTWWPDPNATDPPQTVTCWYPLDGDEELPATTTKKPEPTTTVKPEPTTETTTKKPVVTDLPVVEPTTTIITSTSAPSDGEYKCPSAGIHPDPTDCSSYYNCGAGLEAHHYQCPSGLLFNAETRTCDWAVNVKC